jgi:hypothetical protein
MLPRTFSGLYQPIASNEAHPRRQRYVRRSASGAPRAGRLDAFMNAADDVAPTIRSFVVWRLREVPLR